MSTSTESELPPGCVPRCPGCAHRRLPADASHAAKVAWLARRLAPWRDRLAPFRAAAGPDRWGYRDRLCLSAAWTEGRWHLGLTVADQVVDIPDCPVHTSRARNALRALTRHLPPVSSFPLAFYVQSGGQATLIVKTAEEPDLSWADDTLFGELRAAGLEALWLHKHPSAGRVLFHKNGWRLLWGTKLSRDDRGLWYGPGAFQQLIGALYHQALDEADGFLGCDPNACMVDLYCGSGTTLRRWAERGAEPLGVEIGAEAVACARLNVPEATVLRGKCAYRVPQLTSWRRQHIDGAPLLFANPPRTGLEPEITRWITHTYRPARMAYLSCSAGTLARDLEALEQGGMRVARIRPYDFFPQTYHVETLVLLDRP